MKVFISTVVFIFLILSTPILKAQELRFDQESEPSDSLQVRKSSGEMDIDRLIVNETITKAGNDFHEMFFTQWLWPEALSDEAFIVVISERPFRGIFTQIRISINDLLVFESFLQPKYDQVENLSSWAVEQVSNYILHYQDILRQLEGEDLAGTGIY